MDCQTAEGMVSSYIEHKLPVNELEEFLDHVQNCSSCYDELETYFIVHEVTQQLDDNSSNSVLDFKGLLEQTAGTGHPEIQKIYPQEEIKLVFGRGGDLSSDRCTCGNIGLCNDGNNSYHMRYWRIL